MVRERVSKARARASSVLSILALAMTWTTWVRAEVGYSRIDLATVRVFAVEGVEGVPVKHASKRYTLAVPRAGHGSGLRVTDDGLILTARHVVEGARQVVVRAPGSKTAQPARVIYLDDRRDFAFLSVGGKAKDFVPLPTTPPVLKVRQSVFAIGYPMDPGKRRPQSTRGVISGDSGPGEYTLGISVNPGNSGGPLVDESEQVLGIVVARGDPRKGVQGLGFAVGLDRILRVLPTVRDRHVRAVAVLDAATAAERSQARVVGALVEGEGVWRMLRDARRALTHLEQSALGKGLTDALARPEADPDLLTLGCAYHWNATIMHRVLEKDGWQLSLVAAEKYCKQALRRDATVAVRSPIVKHVVSGGVDYRLHNTQEPKPTSASSRASAPTGAGGFVFGSSPEEVTRVCTRAKMRSTGVPKEGLRCSGAPGDTGFTSVARLRFCDGRLCRIELIEKLEGDDPSTWLARHDKRARSVASLLGAPGLTRRALASECTESLSWCLSNGKAAIHDGWWWAVERSSVEVRLGRVDGRGVVRTVFARH